MNQDQVRKAVLAELMRIAPELEEGELKPDRPLRDQVDLDSFDFLNLIIRLHEILGIDIPESDYAELLTLNGATDYLMRRCNPT